jgi:signal transduction histidine kinase
MSLAHLKDATGPLAGIVALIERAERNTNRMVSMLQELREATSLEAQHVPLKRVDCNMRKVVEDVVDSIDDAQTRRITIEADDDAPCVVLGDVARLERVVANLVTNALKYSADRPVSIRLARAGAFVEVDVIDRGIGIAPENVSKLFERYYRTTASRMRAEGLGLGLYIANMIVQLHGGRIEVASEVGKGSVFRLVLPANVA